MCACVRVRVRAHSTAADDSELRVCVCVCVCVCVLVRYRAGRDCAASTHEGAGAARVHALVEVTRLMRHRIKSHGWRNSKGRRHRPYTGADCESCSGLGTLSTPEAFCRARQSPCCAWNLRTSLYDERISAGATAEL